MSSQCNGELVKHCGIPLGVGSMGRMKKRARLSQEVIEALEHDQSLFGDS